MGPASNETPKAVIFDMDGVLVDSTGAHYLAWKEICREFGRDLGEEEFHRTIGTGTADTARALLGDSLRDVDIDALGRRKEAEYRKAVAGGMTVIDGAPELVRALAAAGWRLGLGTSAPIGNVECVMALFPASDLLTARSHAGLIRNTKPAPDVFLKAAEMLAAPPRRCVVIEDSLAGLEAAAAAGMAGVGLTTTLSREALAARARLVATSLRELTPAILAELVY